MATFGAKVPNSLDIVSSYSENMHLAYYVLSIKIVTTFVILFENIQTFKLNLDRIGTRILLMSLIEHI